MEKTLAIHLQELREQIAQDIEALRVTYGHDELGPVENCKTMPCIVCAQVKRIERLVRGAK